MFYFHLEELKTAGAYAYVVTESGDGLLIIDMKTLDHQFVKTVYNVSGDSLRILSSHTLYVDENQLIYLAGSSGVGGFIILDPGKILASRMVECQQF